MQTIFKDAIIHTMNPQEPHAEALLVRDGIVTIAASNAEAMSFKDNQTVVAELDGKLVYPSFFQIVKNLYGTLVQELEEKKSQNAENGAKKTAKNRQIGKNLLEKSFQKLQDRLLSMGTTTLVDVCLNEESLNFYKELSTKQLLKLDVIGLVEYQQNRHLMDDNCKTYRKYVNHFRLSGYSVFLDGGFKEGKAWRKEGAFRKHSYGFCNYVDEHLNFIFKSILDEKKQLFAFANGNLAIEQFLRCFGEVVEQNKYDDLYRPVLCVSGKLTGKQMQALKRLNVSVVFDMSLLCNMTKRELRHYELLHRHFLPICAAQRLGLRVMAVNFDDNTFDIQKLIFRLAAILGKGKNSLLSGMDDVLRLFTASPAEQFFDDGIKGSLESGKQADFVVIESGEPVSLVAQDKWVLQTYILGNLVKQK